MPERVFVLYLFSLLAAALFFTAKYGRLYVKSSHTREKRDELFLLFHTMCATGAFILIIVAVTSVEWLKKLEDTIGHGAVLAVHLLFAIPFFFLFVFLFFFATGIRAPRHHRLLVYPCLALFAMAFIAGAAMLLGIAP